jgi:hypothetical protein
MAAKPGKTTRTTANGMAAPTAGAAKATSAGAAGTTAKARTTARRKPAAVTAEMIAERAYYIAQSGSGMSDLENWLRAESELLSGAPA